MNSLAALIEGVRPRQAAKNLFVFAALLFANRFASPQSVLQCIAAFFLFFLASGSIYLFNDILDAQQDKTHPVKCKRPIASGRISPQLAGFTSFLLAGTALILGWQLAVRFEICLLTYLVLQISYCVWLKHIVLLDVFVIAAGFLLRTAAGAFAIHVTLSHWLLLCTLLLALFLGLGKRRQELTLLGSKAADHRSILSQYSISFLDQLILMVVTSTLVSYSVYSIDSPTAHQHPHLWLTVPFVLYGICRYMYLVYQHGWGGAPEEVLIQDRPLQCVLILWVLVSISLFLFDHATGAEVAQGIKSSMRIH